MRKFWIVLLSVGLIMALTIPAFGADVKFSGSYYVQGIYDNNRSLKDTDKNTGAGSTQFIAQRLRFQTELQVAEGLKLVTRFDALEKKWGDQTWSASSLYDVSNRASSGIATSRAQENIEWERAYVDFNTGIGRFLVGYQNFVAFGTDFGDSHFTRPGIKYIKEFGNTTLVAAMEQVKEGTSTPSAAPTNQGIYADADNTSYDLAGIQKWKGGEAGLLIQYILNKTNRTVATDQYQTAAWVFDPYVKATFGNWYVEAEALYATGDLAKYEGTGTTNVDVKLNAWGAYVGAKGTFGPAYAGALIAFVSGDDPNTADKKEGGVAAAFGLGQIFSPCLILFNDPNNTWMGGITGFAAATTQFLDNAYLYGLYGGYKPVPKLDIKAALYYAKADKKPTNYVDDVYGTEFDLTATYKIYDNLDYMVGVGYLWVGDYWKGTSTANQTANDYIVTHKLTLSF